MLLLINSIISQCIEKTIILYINLEVRVLHRIQKKKKKERFHVFTNLPETRTYQHAYVNSNNVYIIHIRSCYFSVEGKQNMNRIGEKYNIKKQHGKFKNILINNIQSIWVNIRIKYCVVLWYTGITVSSFEYGSKLVYRGKLWKKKEVRVKLYKKKIEKFFYIGFPKKINVAR